MNSTSVSKDSNDFAVPAKFSPTDETTKVSTATPPLDRAEAEGSVKFYEKGMGWYCVACTIAMRKNGVEGRLECPKCGNSAYFGTISHKQKKCRLEKSQDVQVYPKADGRFVAHTKGKTTAYWVIWDTRYQRFECTCPDFLHRKRYLWHKCKHVLAVERFIAAQEKPADESPVEKLPAFSPIERVGRQSGSKIVSVDAARPNGHGSYACQLTGRRHSDGGVTHISTTLDGDSLRVLGWEAPLQARKFAFVRLDGVCATSAQTAVKDEVVDDLDARAQAIAESYQNIGWKRFHGCLAKVARKLGIDEGMIEAYYARKYSVSSLSGLSERDREWVSARLQGAATHEKLLANLEREVRDTLSRHRCVFCGVGVAFGEKRCGRCMGRSNPAQETHIDCSGNGNGNGNGSVRVSTHKKRNGRLRAQISKSQSRTCPTCGVKCKGRFCSVCVDRMLDKKGWTRTDNLPTTRANIRIPTAI